MSVYFPDDLPREEFTYLIQAGGPKGLVKIGSTVDVEKRLRGLQVGNGLTLRLLLVLPGAHHEKELHRRFAPWRRKGEWFDHDADGLMELVRSTETERKEVRKLIENSLEAA